MYLDANGKVQSSASTDGYLAVATPGTVAGMYAVHRRYGKLPWQEVVKPSIALAKNGFIISDRVSWRSFSAYEIRKKAILNNQSAKDIFTRDGEYYQPGEKLIQRDLANTLEAISQNPQSFYTGKNCRNYSLRYGKKWWFNYSRRFKSLQTNLAKSCMWELSSS